MGEKTAGVGHFTIPTAPVGGVSVVSGLANVFTTTYVAVSAAAPAAIFITGIHSEKAAASAGTYNIIQLATGTAGSESIVGQYLVPLSTGSTVALGYRAIYPPIPVANGVRIACKTADSVGSQTSLVTLECINQSNVVDDGVAVGTVTTVTNQLTAAQIATGVWQDTTAGDFTTALSVGKSVMNGVTLGTGLTVANVSGSVGSVTGLTASNLDATVSSRMATYTQPTGFLAATFPVTVASTTNITSASGVSLAASQHVIVDSGTVTTLTNLPSIPANWITAAGITAAALNGKGDWNIGKTGYSLTQTFPTNFSTLAITVGGAVTAGTVSDKTGYSLAAAYDLAKTAAQAGDAMTLTAAYAAAKTAAQAGDSMALTIAERAAVADALLARNVSGGSSAGRTVKQALAVLRNKVEVVAGTLTVYDTDDTTALFTATVITAAGNPIASIDPA